MTEGFAAKLGLVGVGVAIGLTAWMGLRNLGLPMALVRVGQALGVGVVAVGRLTDWMEARGAARRAEGLRRLREGISDCDRHICTM